LCENHPVSENTLFQNSVVNVRGLWFIHSVFWQFDRLGTP